MMKPATATPKCLKNLMAALDAIVDKHMEIMLSFGEPISRYYRQYEYQQRIGSLAR